MAKQRTSKDSNVAAQPPQDEQPRADSSAAQEQAIRDESGDDGGSPVRNVVPKYEYVAMHRPLFDYQIENRQLGEDSLDEEAFHDWYEGGFKAENEAGITLKPAKEHPDHKWCILWEGFELFMEYRRRSKYCCPDLFDTYIYNDFEGYGYQELLESFDDDALKHMWAIISAISLWINEVDQYPLIGNEHGEKTEDVLDLIGYALLRGLAALDAAGQLKPDTEFPDNPFVVTSFLAFSQSLPEYGIESNGVEWRPHAAAYFEKGKSAHEKGISHTERVLESAKGGSASNLPNQTDKDPWRWDELLKAYKRRHGADKGGRPIGGTYYDITKMSRQERADHADGKDPLAHISIKDLKANILDIA